MVFFTSVERNAVQKTQLSNEAFRSYAGLAHRMRRVHGVLTNKVLAPFVRVKHEATCVDQKKQIE